MVGFISQVSFSQEKDKTQALIFDYNELHKVKIIADFDAIFNNVSDPADYHEAKMIANIGKYKYKFDVELKPRGHFRRNPDHCNFPPLRINFKKKHIKGTPFEHSDKVKLVTHCNIDDEHANDNVLTEYLIYKMFNILSDTSFRVSLAKFKYVNRSPVNLTLKRYGFFIEKTNHLELRTQLQEFEPEYINYQQLEKGFFSLVSLFSYLIGNSDYSVLVPQNVKLLAEKKEGPFVIVPYDFDLSKMVNPFYAPYNQYDENRQEVAPTIKGYCQEYSDFMPAIKKINTKKQDLYMLVNNFDRISKEKRKKILNRLDRFYQTINNEHLFLEVFDNYCKND